MLATRKPFTVTTRAFFALQGSPQWLSVTFERPVHVEQIHVQFQGGFAAKTCTLIDGSDHSAPPLAKFYPEDTNSLQAKR